MCYLLTGVITLCGGSVAGSCDITLFWEPDFCLAAFLSRSITDLRTSTNMYIMKYILRKTKTWVLMQTLYLQISQLIRLVWLEATMSPVHYSQYCVFYNEQNNRSESRVIPSEKKAQNVIDLSVNSIALNQTVQMWWLILSYTVFKWHLDDLCTKCLKCL